MPESFNIHFACQRCQQPLKIDPSLNHLDEHQLAELSLPVINVGQLQMECDTASRRANEQSTESLSDSAGASFTILDDSNKPKLSGDIKRMAGLFDLMSGRSELNHPLCEDCTDSLLEAMDQQLGTLEMDCHQYTEYINKMRAEAETFDMKALQRELEDLRSEEERLTSELALLKEEEATVEKEISHAQREKERLDSDEQLFWKEYNKYTRELAQLEDENYSLNQQLSYTASQLAKLKKSNVFNSTFHIWHSNHIVTINNFRLGRLPSEPVDWAEINAAWGQTTLLLVALARKAQFTFHGYKLVPYGSHSYVLDLEDNKILPLHASGGLKFIWDTTFDQAMTAFLDCLQQFKRLVESSESGFNLPYKMDKGKITDSGTGKSYPIAIKLNREEEWTKALKLMLTNLKWVIAWVSSQFHDD